MTIIYKYGVSVNFSHKLTFLIKQKANTFEFSAKISNF
jgi:hypothetical protein